MSIKYIPQGIPIVSSSFAISGSIASVTASWNSGTASLAAHGLNMVGLTGYPRITASAEPTLANTGSQGLTILVINTGSLGFKMATSSFSTVYSGAYAGQIDAFATYGGGPGWNPTLNLVRGRTYRFRIRGEPPAEVETIFNVTNVGSGQYQFDVGASGPNPTLTLIRGYRYEFNIDASGHPFWLQTSAGGYNAGNVYNNGVINNGTQVGRMQIIVPHNAPNTLYYYCQFHSSMGGQINIIDDGLYRIALQTASGSYSGGSLYTTGVTGNNTKSGSLTFAVAAGAPSTLYYASQDVSGMRGLINITG